MSSHRRFRITDNWLEHKILTRYSLDPQDPRSPIIDIFINKNLSERSE